MSVIKLKCNFCGGVSSNEYKSIYELPTSYTCYGCGKVSYDTTELFRVYNISKQQKHRRKR